MNIIHHFQELYHQTLRNREVLWSELEGSDFNQSWFTTRLKEYQWSIDEILRHSLASEIVYLQQPFKPDIPMFEKPVKAQWVGKVFFRRAEDHVEYDELKSYYGPIEDKSQEILANINKKDLNKKVTAPWQEKVTTKFMVDHFFNHENYHRGQAHFLITNLRGPPVFEEDWSKLN